jgi:hypothetical protein
MGAPVKSPDVGVFVRPGRLPARTGMTEDTGPKRRNKFARHERLLKSQAKHPGNRPDKVLLWKGRYREVSSSMMRNRDGGSTGSIRRYQARRMNVPQNNPYCLCFFVIIKPS